MKNTDPQNTVGNAPAFTSGPWRASKPQGLAHWNIEGDGINLANVWGFVGSPTLHDRNGQGAANACLIAAAPELLEALHKLAAEVSGLRAFESELRAELGNINWNVLMLRLSEADAAIAKAEGRA